MTIVINELGQMSNKNPKTRLYVQTELKAGAVILVENGQGHYLVNVMRINMGDYVSLFNGEQGEWIAETTKVGKGKANVTVREKVADQIFETDLWYLFAPIKKARLDYMMQKATELGVNLIRPVKTERTNLDRLKFDKLQANAVEAAEQCGRMTVPAIGGMTSLSDLLSEWPEDRKLIFCDEAGDAVQLKDIKELNAKWAILIGPEGGFTDQERQMIRSHKNSVAVTLGPRILRADTAAVVALSLWQSFIGDWSNE